VQKELQRRAADYVEKFLGKRGRQVTRAEKGGATYLTFCTGEYQTKRTVAIQVKSGLDLSYVIFIQTLDEEGTINEAEYRTISTMETQFPLFDHLLAEL
jgi:hypothetical protein